MEELLTKKYENIDEFLDYWKGKSNVTILEMEDFIIAIAEKRGWDIDTVKKYLEDVKKDTEIAKKLQQQATEENRVKQAEEKIAKIVEGFKNETDLEKRKKSLEEIGEIPSLITAIEPMKPYSLEAIKADIKNYDPDKFFCPKLFNELPFPDGTLSVIGARTSRGKTTTLINLAAEAMEAEENKRKVLFITLEMSVQQLYFKLVLRRAYAQANAGKKSELISPTFTPIKDLPKFINSNGTATELNETFKKSVESAVTFVDNEFNANMLQMFQAQSKTQDQIINLISQEEKGTLVLIDYIQRMPLTEKASRDRYIQIKEISNALMNATIKSEVVTICAAQFNREAGQDNNGDDKFTDASFRESGDIEQDAHNAIGIGWENKKQDRFYEILKARESEVTGKHCGLEFKGAYSYMENNKINRNDNKKGKKKKQKDKDIQYDDE